MVLKLIIGSPIATNIPFWKLIKVNAVMFNAYDIIRKKSIYARILRGESLREILDIPKGIEIWIDSGGYQIMVKGLRVSLTQVIERYRRLDADLYMSLDIPPRDIGCEDRELVNRNIENYEYIRSKLEDKEVIPVVHCYAPDLILYAIDRYR